MNQMELPKEELDRMMFFEEARKRAEADHKANPTDAQVHPPTERDPERAIEHHGRVSHAARAHPERPRPQIYPPDRPPLT